MALTDCASVPGPPTSTTRSTPRPPVSARTLSPHSGKALVSITSSTPIWYTRIFEFFSIHQSPLVLGIFRFSKCGAAHLGSSQPQGETSHPGFLARRLEPCLLSVHH